MAVPQVDHGDVSRSGMAEESCQTGDKVLRRSVVQSAHVSNETALMIAIVAAYVVTLAMCLVMFGWPFDWS